MGNSGFNPGAVGSHWSILSLWWVTVLCSVLAHAAWGDQVVCSVAHGGDVPVSWTQGRGSRVGEK